MRKRCSWLQTTSGDANAPPTARSAVSWSIEWSETSGQSCLGKLSRETGQSRVPEPPERMTGTTCPLCAPGGIKGWGRTATFIA